MRRPQTSQANFPRPAPRSCRTSGVRTGPGTPASCRLGDRGAQWLLATSALVIALIRLLHTRLALDLDFETIQRVSRTATLADLSQVENDALYLIHFLPHVLLPGPRTPLLVLVLVEHKASVDYYTPRVRCPTPHTPHPTPHAPHPTPHTPHPAVLHLFHRRTAAEYDEEAPVVFDLARTLFAHAQTEVDQMAQSMADVIRERGERIGEQRGIVQMQDLVLAGVEARFRGALQSVEARVRALRTAEALQQAQRALVGAANEEEFLTRLAGGPGGASGT